MKKKSVFFSYIQNNKRTFLCLTIAFLFGIIIGIIFINKANESQIDEICSYVNSLTENIKSSDNINRTIVLLQSMKENIIFILIIWFLGCTILRRIFYLYCYLV